MTWPATRPRALPCTPPSLPGLRGSLYPSLPPSLRPSLRPGLLPSLPLSSFLLSLPVPRSPPAAPFCQELSGAGALWTPGRRVPRRPIDPKWIPRLGWPKVWRCALRPCTSAAKFRVPRVSWVEPPEQQFPISTAQVTISVTYQSNLGRVCAFDDDIFNE